MADGGYAAASSASPASAGTSSSTSLARRIEKAFNRPEGWLDVPHSQMLLPQPRADENISPARDLQRGHVIALDMNPQQRAEVLEVAKSLAIDKKVAFLSSTRLQDGNREFIYQESQEASAAKGTLRVPETFTLGLAPYLGAAKYSLVARLRFRIEESKLVLWYDLLRPHKVVEDAFNNVVAQLETGLKVSVLRGSVAIPPCAG